MFNRAEAISCVLGFRPGPAFGVWLFLASAASAADWYVDQSYTGCGQSDGSQSKPFCTITAALQVAAAGDSIHLAPGTYQENGNTLGFDFDLRLIGTQGSAVTRIDGAGTHTVLWITSGPVVELVGLTIQGGSTSEYGGAIYVSDSTLTLTDCTVTTSSANNPSYGRGAGLYSYNSDLTLERTVVSENQAETSGGGIYVQSGSLTMIDCTVHHNGSRWGPGIFASTGAVVDITSSTIDDNWRVGYGGGGGLSLSDSIAMLSKCAFANNEADLGGAIYHFPNCSVTAMDTSFDGNTAILGGAIYAGSSTQTLLEDCTFLGNIAHPSDSITGQGGALYGQGFEARHTRFESNRADGFDQGYGGSGGAVALIGPGTFERCRFLDNTADGSSGRSDGGALAVSSGKVTLTDCELTGNTASSTLNGIGGIGGGCYLGNNAIVCLTRCTLAGNHATGSGIVTQGGEGGGLWITVGGALTLAHVIVAANDAANASGVHDVKGTATTAGYNLIGDSTGLTLVGAGPGDLLDVDPQFVDPLNGDYSLQASSPCVESGDSALPPAGKDVAANPRVLDADLDRTLRVDRGAREFNHVHLSLSGQATPGGMITLETSGTPGLALFMVVGVGTGELLVPPFGSLFIDLSQSFLFLPWGTIPSCVNVTLDPSTPAPLTILLQEVAFAPPSGNLSNVVELVVE